MGYRIHLGGRGVGGGRSGLVGRGRGSLVGGSRGSLVAGGRGRGSGVGLGLGVLGLALVADLGHVATVTVHGVGDLLEPAVGQGHVVGAGGGSPITSFGLSEVAAAVGVGNSVLVAVCSRDVGICSMMSSMVKWKR